jgi:hypothetical protein
MGVIDLVDADIRPANIMTGCFLHFCDIGASTLTI